jgi:glycosyltransferase involved in cell wall biosynthesis
MARDNPTITAMMLVRDRADLLADAAATILAQTDADLELVICDDGSVDDTWAVAQRIAASDERVVLLRNESSRGIPAARNQVLAVARGRYLATCDSDDLSRSERFARQRALLDADAALVGAGVRINAFDGDDPSDGNEPDWHWGLRDGRLPFAFPGAMLRIDAVRTAGGFDERYRVAEDLHLAYRLGGRGGRFATVDEVLLDYRIHAGSITQRRAASREWWTYRAQLRGLLELRGRFSARGWAVVVQTKLRGLGALVGLHR